MSDRDFVDFVSATGANPVRAWLKSNEVPVEARAKLEQKMLFIRTTGWREPHGKILTSGKCEGLREVRAGYMGNIYRILACQGLEPGQTVLLHGFVKKTQKIPNRECTLAQNRRREVESGIGRVEPHEYGTP